MKKKIVMIMLLGAMIFETTACGLTGTKYNTETPSTDTSILPETETDIALSTEPKTIPDAELSGTEASDSQNTSTENLSSEASSSENIGSEAFGSETKDNSQNSSSGDIIISSREDAELLLQTMFGTKDTETGYSYSFSYIDTFTIGDGEYYGFVWSWLVDGHMSRLTEVFVKTDGSAVYEGLYDGENCEFYSDNMLE